MGADNYAIVSNDWTTTIEGTVVTRKHLSAIALALLLAGCGDTVTKLVNERFPPINVDQQRQMAIDTTATALASMPAPKIALGVDLDDVQYALFSDALRNSGISSLKLAGDEQLLNVQANFKRKFTAADAGDNAALKAALGTLSAQVEGTLEMYAGVTGALSAGQPMPSLELKLLPGLSRVTVEKILVGENVDATKVAQGIADLLNKYRDNITGELTRAPFSSYTLPAVAPNALDVAKALQPKKQEPNVTVEVTAKPVNLPLKWDGIAWLITPGQLTAVLQLSAKTAPPPPTVNVDKTWRGIRGQIEGTVEDSFGIKSIPDKTWIAIRRDLLAETVNDMAAQAGLCATVTAREKVHSENKIPMPDASKIPCDSDRKCEGSRKCSFNASKDERSCNRCLAHSPRVCWPWGGGCAGGGCIVEGNDPLCEIAKAAQNQIYLADANLRKADCDRLNAQDVAACQLEEVGKKALCETGKGILSGLQRTGNFANLDLDADISSNNLRVCLRDFKVGSALESVNLGIEVTGEATADVNLTFTPLDIVGHLACQFPWAKSQTFTASLRDSQLAAASDVKLVADKGKARLDFNTKEINVKAKLSPGPTEFLVKSPEILISCAGLNLLAPLVVSATPFIPALRGELDHKIAGEQRSLELPLPEPAMPGATVQLESLVTPKAIGVTGQLVPSKK